MYTLTYEGLTLYDPRLTDRDIYNVDTHLAVDEAGSMSFDMPPTHPHIDALSKLKGRLELSSDGAVIWRGRVLSDETDFNGVATIEAEGQLACLNDSIVPPFTFPDDYENEDDYQNSSNVVEYWLGLLIASHNAQVSEEQQIKLGTVTVSDPNNYIVRSSEDYMTTWDCVTDKLRDSSLGGHFLVRYESDGTYLDYVADYPLTNTQSVEFAQNLLDLTDGLDASDVYTAILPLGKDKLTIEDLPDGEVTTGLMKEGKTIYSSAGVEEFGKITAIQTWDDVTVNTNLQSKAAALLAQTGVMLSRSISVTAVDLHCTDETIATLRVGRYTPIVSAPHDLNVQYVLSELDLDIQDPGSTRLTFGTTTKSQSDRVNSIATNAQSAKSTAESAHSSAESAKESVDGLTETTKQQYADLTSDVSGIKSDIAEVQTTVSNNKTDIEKRVTSVEETASGLTVTVEKQTESITKVEGDLQDYKTTISKYMTFDEDFLTIRMSGSTTSVQITNERINFNEDGYTAAYISGKKLYIPDAVIENSLRIGKFAFVPRNSGNLSLVLMEG